MDCFVASAPRNDVKAHLHDLAARARVLLGMSCPLKHQRAQGMPGARCARSLACKNKKAYERSHHGHTGYTPHSPRNGFNGFLRALPGDRAWLPPSLADHSANLMPASGHQNHTTSPSASVLFVKSTISVHHIPPRVRDDRDTPLSGTRRRSYNFDLGEAGMEMFLQTGLDSPNQIDPVEQITFSAQSEI
jgi:hypothetical protein